MLTLIVQRSSSDQAASSPVSRSRTAISGAAGSIPGSVTDNASLIFNRSDAVPFGGVVSGAGSLTKTGTGRYRFALD